MNNMERINIIINKLSSVLNSTQKIIPLYEEIKPLFYKAKQFKEKLSKIDLNKFKNYNKKENDTIVSNKKNYFNSSPQFFH